MNPSVVYECGRCGDTYDSERDAAACCMCPLCATTPSHTAYWPVCAKCAVHYTINGATADDRLHQIQTTVAERDRLVACLAELRAEVAPKRRRRRAS